MGEIKHLNTTVFFIDMKGFTSRTSSSSREELKKTLEDYEQLVVPVIKDFGGKIIKGLGDAYLISFHSPTNAVLCGLEIQKKIKERNHTVEKKERFDARIGISSGEVYEKEGDIFGEPVNLASRVQSVAQGGQVVLAESTYHAMNKNEFDISSIGKHSLKGINDKIQIFTAHEKGKKPSLSGVRNFFRRFFKRWYIYIPLMIFFLLILSSMGNKIDGNWGGEANAALEKQDYKSINNLIRTYENSPDELKDINAMLMVAKLYHAIGKDDKAKATLLEAWNKSSNPEQKLQIYNTARQINPNLPAINDIQKIKDILFQGK